MGLFGWILMILCGIILFLVFRFLEIRYSISKLEKFILSIFLWMILAGFFSIGKSKILENFFFIFVFQMITDVVYSSYFVERDFFHKGAGNLSFYFGLILVGFFINQEFFQRVDHIFLTGEDLRLILWSFMILFLYYFVKNHQILSSREKKESIYMSRDMVLTSYAKLKDQYYEECDFSDKTLSNLVYAFMIYENHRRSKILRDFDYFLFRLKGDKRKLGIMQIETNRFISDAESIQIAASKIEKLYQGKGKKKVSPEEVIEKYALKDASKVQSIFDIIRKF